MKVFILLILSVMYCVSALAQSLIKPDHKVVNMGVKVGLRALSRIFHRLTWMRSGSKISTSNTM